MSTRPKLRSAAPVRLDEVAGVLRAAYGELLTSPDKVLKEVVTVAVRAAAEIVQESAIELAPLNTGMLETSSKVEVRGGSATIGFDTDYATKVHEMPEISRGEGTRGKAGNELGLAGPKYLERPLVAMQEKIRVIAAEVLAKHLQEQVG